jgi:hypothetical protein
VTTDISLGRDSQVFGMEYNVEKQNIGKEHSSTDSPRGSEWCDVAGLLSAGEQVFGEMYNREWDYD